MIDDFDKRMEVPQLKSKKLFKKIVGMYPCLSEENNKTHQLNKLLKFCYLRRKNRKIQCLRSKTRSYLKIISIELMRYVLKLARKLVWEVSNWRILGLLWKWKKWKMTSAVSLDKNQCRSKLLDRPSSNIWQKQINVSDSSLLTISLWNNV